MRTLIAACVVAVAGAISEVDAQTVLARLWQDPRPIAARDLQWGSGSADRAPRAPFTFIEEPSDGTQPKVVIKDAAGVTWDVKFGPEAHAEVAANRLVWAVGYFVEEVYHVPGGRIDGVTDLGRAERAIGPDGTFVSARFRRRDPDRPRHSKSWGFNDNPFAGKRELSGLKIMMTLIGNWDVEGDRNNAILATAGGTPPEHRYIVADLGGSFGRMGARLTNHSKWVLADYQAEGFIDKVDDDEIELDFDGLESNMEIVPRDHARWLAEIVGELTESQIRQAFESAGATPDEVNGFSAVVLNRIAALKAAVTRDTREQ